MQTDKSNYEESLFSVIDSCEPHFDYLIDDESNLVFPAPISVNDLSEVLKDKGYNNNVFKYLGNRKGMLSKIVKSIEKGNPVILNQLDIPGLLYNYISNAEYSEEMIGFPLYTLSCNFDDYGKGIIGVPDKWNVMTAHYVTITGIILDRESENEWLRVQSWGEQYYILFNDFCNYNDYLDWAEGTIVVIK